MRIGLASLLFLVSVTATRLAHAQTCDPAYPEAPEGRSVITTTFAPAFGTFAIGGVDGFGGNAQTTMSFSNNRVEFRKQRFKCRDLDARCDNDGQGELVGYWEINDTTETIGYLDAGFVALVLDMSQRGEPLPNTGIHEVFCFPPIMPCLVGPAVATPAASVGRTLTVFMRGASRAQELVVARRCAGALTQAACGVSDFAPVTDRGAGHTFGWGGLFVTPIPAQNPNGCSERLRANIFGSGEGDVFPEFTQCMEDELGEWFADEAIDDNDNRVGDQCDFPSIEYPSGNPATAEASAQNEFVFPTTDPPNLQIQMRSAGGVNDQAFRWRVEGLPAGSFSWSPAAPGEATVGAGPSPTLTILRLFGRPTDFGLKTVSLYDASGQIADSAKFELFWPIFKAYQPQNSQVAELVNYADGNFATNHTPGNHPGLVFGAWVSDYVQPTRAPNWFFYWRQILAGLDTHRAFANWARYCNQPDEDETGAVDANCAFAHPVGQYCVTRLASYVNDGDQYAPADQFGDQRFRIDALATTMWHEWQHVSHIIAWSKSELGWTTNAAKACVRDNGLGMGDWKLRPRNSQGVCLFPQPTDADCDGVPDRLDGPNIDDDHQTFDRFAPATTGATESKDWSFPGPNHRSANLKD